MAFIEWQLITYWNYIPAFRAKGSFSFLFFYSLGSQQKCVNLLHLRPAQHWALTFITLLHRLLLYSQLNYKTSWIRVQKQHQLGHGWLKAGGVENKRWGSSGLGGLFCCLVLGHFITRACLCFGRNIPCASFFLVILPPPPPPHLLCLRCFSCITKDGSIFSAIDRSANKCDNDRWKSLQPGGQDKLIKIGYSISRTWWYYDEYFRGVGASWIVILQCCKHKPWKPGWGLHWCFLWCCSA